jgi:hypothetical protein
MTKPFLLSTPHMGDRELEFVKEAFAAPVFWQTLEQQQM